MFANDENFLTVTVLAVKRQPCMYHVHVHSMTLKVASSTRATLRAEWCFEKLAPKPQRTFRSALMPSAGKNNFCGILVHMTSGRDLKGSFQAVWA